jgi:hypothetical protein
LGSIGRHNNKTMTAAAITSYEASTLTLDGGQQLACLYVVVDGRTDPAVSRFLAGWGECCSTSDLDWQAVRRPRSALVGVDLVHSCGAPAGGHLRLVFDVRRDRDALGRLADTEALVVGTRAYGSFANVVSACGVDGGAVRAAIDAAERSLSHVTAAVAAGA